MRAPFFIPPKPMLSPRFAFQAEADAIARRNAHWRRSMTAASARAISSHQNAATRQGLERAVAWSRQWSWEFPFCLANHLPMVLVALHRMGASDERLEAYCHIYREQNGLVPVPGSIGKITSDNWR